jgi:uncharacterized protein
MDQAALLQKILLSDTLRQRALQVVARFGLPDCWIGAGFVRDAVWDHLHGFTKRSLTGDVDVIWFSRENSNEDNDLHVEQQLCEEMPELRWSVKNQARMHYRNGDAPYTSVADAMRYWPETATAVAVRFSPSGSIEVNAPFGLNDLFELKLLPTPAFLERKLTIFQDRVTSKCWIERYPQLTVMTSAAIKLTAATEER